MQKLSYPDAYRRQLDLRPWTARLLAILTLAAASAGLAHGVAAADRPNILFIMADDHGYQAISAYGHQINQTPHMDRLAREGMRFDRCFVTNSICGPSRAVILTGKYSHLNGMQTNDQTFDGSQPTLPKYLQQAGYQTAIVGKWHLKSDPTGFDYWNVLIGQGPYYNPPMKTANGVVKHVGYTTDIITDLTIDWLQNQRDDSRPFFLMCHHKAPHRNWQPGPKYLDRYDDTQIPEPDTLFDDYSGRTDAARQQEMTIARHLTPHDLKLTPQRELNEQQRQPWDQAYAEENRAFQQADLSGRELVRWKFQRFAKDYLRCIESVDESVGRILEYLDQSGLADNTLVVYTSDQGWYLGEHGWFDKRWMYEESLRTPLLIRWPGHIAPGSVDNHLVLNLDFAETFLDVAQAEIPEQMQGRSLRPLLEGDEPPDWRDAIYYRYYEYPGPHSVRQHLGVRTDRYKLIQFHQSGDWELFDLQSDPHELQSVYGDPQYATIQAELKEKLAALQQQFQDQPPEPN